MKDKVSLITGSSRGIGYEIARGVARQGSHVILNGFDPQRIEDAAKKLQEEFREVKVVGIAADVSQAQEVKKLYEKSLEAFGAIHQLVNNAGITRDNLLLRMKETEWDEVMEVNLKSAFLVTKQCIRSMLKTGGRIVMVSSVVGETGNVGQANYAASKGGLISFGKSVARELAGKNINVNIVTPGFIDTEMTHGLPENTKRNLIETIPKKRLGKVEDVANLVCFLLSNEADYITGQVIGINGGMVI